jgi:hypothetical protein
MTTLTLLKGQCRDLNGPLRQSSTYHKVGSIEAGIRYIPRVDILSRREPLLPRVRLALEEALELEELLLQDVVLEQSQPALVQGVDLEGQELALLVRQAGHPLVLVELWRRRLGRVSGGAARCGGCGLRGAEEGHDVAVLLRLLGIRAVGCAAARLALQGGHCVREGQGRGGEKESRTRRSRLRPGAEKLEAVEDAWAAEEIDDECQCRSSIGVILQSKIDE